MSTTKADEAAIRSRLRRQNQLYLLKLTGKTVFGALLTFAVVIFLWQCVIWFSGINSFTGKGPRDVFEYLFITDPSKASTAAENRAELWPLLWETLRDASIGFVVGMVVAVGLAMSFTLSKTVEAGVMPFALFLRSVPLVAIAPAILILTGRGNTLSVAVIGTIVVLFPALASVMFGLSRANKQSLDLVKVYGGSNSQALTKVAIPGALPSIFAAARVSVPGAVTGAMLAEWLSTGKGVGGAIMAFTSTAKYNDLWSSVAMITFMTLIIYNVVQLAEDLVLARMGMSQNLT